MSALWFQAGKVLFSQQSALNQLIGKFNESPANVAAWLANPQNKLEVDNLAGALNLWASQQPPQWPNPPGVPFPLDPTQKVALFKLETGLGTEGEWLATMPPGLSNDTLNLYKQFYATGGDGWGEVQDWYAHR